DDGNRGDCLLGRQGGRRGNRDNHIHVEPPQLGGKLRKAIKLLLGEATLNNEVLAFHVTQLTQGFPRGLLDTSPRRQIANSVDLPRRLRVDGERRGEQGGGEQKDQHEGHGGFHRSLPSSSSRMIASAWRRNSASC